MDSEKWVLITGASGAGKQLVQQIFEDLGYTCVDNLPPGLLPGLVSLVHSPHWSNEKRVTVVIDTRSGDMFNQTLSYLRQAQGLGADIKVLYLDASDEVLVQRFKETRRKHPLFQQYSTILEAIRAEKKVMEPIREMAHHIIDTSQYTPSELRMRLKADYGQEGHQSGLCITVCSFGFKHGVPIDADLIFDVRFLRNPHYQPELRELTGISRPIREYVFEDELAEPFMNKLMDLVSFTLPQYIKEGKAYLTIGIGCTGGRHRSVVMAEELAARLEAVGYRVGVQHRDIGTPPMKAD